MEHLLDGSPIAGRLRERIVEVTGGNPLFIEEMLSRLIDDGLLESAAELPLPTTVNVLLQSRLDALAPEQRRLLEEGSIEGKVFHRGAVEALASPARRDGIDACLTALVRMALVRPTSPPSRASAPTVSGTC